MSLRITAPLATLLALSAPALAHNDLLYPVGGETVQVGEQMTIEWSILISHPLASWDILYSVNGAQGPFIPIALGLPPGDMATGSIHTYDWIVPDIPTANARIQVIMNGVSGMWQSTSAADFTIEPSFGVRSCGGQTTNSSGAFAAIHMTGDESAAANGLVLRVVDLPTNTVGYPINSDTLGFVVNPGGSSGNLCLGGSIGRHVTQVTGSGAAGYAVIPLDLTQLPRVGTFYSAVAGETWSFQFWYRDANPTITSNFSDVVSVTLL